MKTNLILSLTLLMLIFASCAKEAIEPDVEARKPARETAHLGNGILIENVETGQVDDNIYEEAYQYPFLIDIGEGTIPFFNLDLNTVEFSVLSNPEYNGEYDQHYGIRWDLTGYDLSGAELISDVQTGPDAYLFTFEEDMWPNILSSIDVSVKIYYYSDAVTDCGDLCASTTSFCLNNMTPNSSQGPTWFFGNNCMIDIPLLPSYSSGYGGIQASATFVPTNCETCNQ